MESLLQSTSAFLPTWTYREPHFFAGELQFFHKSWQILCHISEIPIVGDSLILEWAGSKVIAYRESASVVGCYYVMNSEGSDPAASIDLAKSRRQFPQAYVQLIEGLVFISFRPDGRDIAAAFSPFLEELREHQVSSCSPLGRKADVKEIDVNWKLLVEISLDETHVPSVHPQVAGLMGGAHSYRRHKDVRRWHQTLIPNGKMCLAAKAYVRLLQLTHGPSLEWIYLWIFPGAEIEIYPEQIAYYQTIPISPTRSLKRARRLAVPTKSPMQHLLRVLNDGIQQRIDDQDIECVKRRHEILKSIENVPMADSQSDSLVKKFHQCIYESVLGE